MPVSSVYTVYDCRIAGVNTAIAKANSKMPLATWVVGDTFLFALCCDHFMRNSLGLHTITVLQPKKREWIYMYIYTHIYYIYIYIHTYVYAHSTLAMLEIADATKKKMQPACMQKFIAGPSSASSGVEGPWYVSTAPPLTLLLHCWVQHPALQQQEQWYEKLHYAWSTFSSHLPML